MNENSSTRSSCQPFASHPELTNRTVLARAFKVWWFLHERPATCTGYSISIPASAQGTPPIWMAGSWGLGSDFSDYGLGHPDPAVSPKPGSPNTGVGPETVAILVACIGAPVVVICAVVFGKRCYKRFKRLRKVSHRKDDLEGVDNYAMDVEEFAPGLVRSVGGSVVIVQGGIRPSPIHGRLHRSKKRCYDQDSIDYGDDANAAFPDDILAEIDETHSKVKSNGIEVQIEDKLKTSSLSDTSSYAHDPRIRSQLNGYANGHLPQNGVKCTAVSTIAEVLRETLAENTNNNTDLSIRDCEIIIHAICENELKVKEKQKVIDECPLRRLAPERMTMPTGPISFPRRKSSTPSIRSLKSSSKNAESWLHSAYLMTRARPLKTERSG